MGSGKKKAKTQVNLRLEDEDFRLLKALADEAGKPHTALATEYVVQALSRGGTSEDQLRLDTVLDILSRLDRELPRRVAAAVLESVPQATRNRGEGRKMTLQEFAERPHSEDATEEDLEE